MFPRYETAHLSEVDEARPFMIAGFDNTVPGVVVAAVVVVVKLEVKVVEVGVVVVEVEEVVVKVVALMLRARYANVTTSSVRSAVCWVCALVMVNVTTLVIRYL